MSSFGAVADGADELTRAVGGVPKSRRVGVDLRKHLCRLAEFSKAALQAAKARNASFVAAAVRFARFVVLQFAE
jgi:hypothetical protein